MKIIKKYFQLKISKAIESDLDFLAYYTKSGIKYLDGSEVKHTITLKNKKCHQNSYDLYVKDKNFKIKIAWCIENNDISNSFIHFLNYNIETKEYVDETLGGESRFYTYYILPDNFLYRHIDKEDASPDSWLGWAKKDFYSKYATGYWAKKFIKESDF